MKKIKQKTNKYILQKQKSYQNKSINYSQQKLKKKQLISQQNIQHSQNQQNDLINKQNVQQLEDQSQQSCWQKFYNKLKYLFILLINYLQFDQVFTQEQLSDLKYQQKYILKKKYPQNYYQTYQERQKKFAYKFTDILKLKQEQELKKQKDFWTEFKRFICCQGGNQLEEVDQLLTQATDTEEFIKLKRNQKVINFKKNKKNSKDKQLSEYKDKGNLLIVNDQNTFDNIFFNKDKDKDQDFDQYLRNQKQKQEKYHQNNNRRGKSKKDQIDTINKDKSKDSITLKKIKKINEEMNDFNPFQDPNKAISRSKQQASKFSQKNDSKNISKNDSLNNSINQKNNQSKTEQNNQKLNKHKNNLKNSFKTQQINQIDQNNFNKFIESETSKINVRSSKTKLDQTEIEKTNIGKQNQLKNKNTTQQSIKRNKYQTYQNNNQAQEDQNQQRINNNTEYSSMKQLKSKNKKDRKKKFINNNSLIIIPAQLIVQEQINQTIEFDKNVKGKFFQVQLNQELENLEKISNRNNKLKNATRNQGKHILNPTISYSTTLEPVSNKLINNDLNQSHELDSSLVKKKKNRNKKKLNEYEMQDNLQEVIIIPEEEQLKQKSNKKLQNYDYQTIEQSKTFNTKKQKNQNFLKNQLKNINLREKKSRLFDQSNYFKTQKQKQNISSQSIDYNNSFVLQQSSSNPNLKKKKRQKKLKQVQQNQTNMLIVEQNQINQVNQIIQIKDQKTKSNSNNNKQQSSTNISQNDNINTHELNNNNSALFDKNLNNSLENGNYKVQKKRKKKKKIQIQNSDNQQIDIMEI